MNRIGISRLFTSLLIAFLLLAPLATASAKPAAAERGPHLSGAIESLSELNGDVPGETSTARLTCTTEPAASADYTAGNVLQDCAFVRVAPHNEPHIAVNPTNPNNLVAGANGYEFYFQGGRIIGRSYNDFRASFDGGKTWKTGFLDMQGFNTASDPVFAYDSAGNAYYSNIAYHTSQGGAAASNGSIIVAKSTDGGASFSLPVLVHKGFGNLGTSFFDDKEWMTVDTQPSSPYKDRVYVTWTGFEAGAGGAYLRSAIWFSASSDGGQTWTKAKEISGSGSFCATQTTGPDFQCDEDQFSIPTVGPDGTLYVAFENSNTANEDFRSQYLVVRSPDGGQTWQGPFLAAKLIDGTLDYPVNVSGRQTLTGVQYRVNSAGMIASGPDGALYLTWSDNRNGSAGQSNTDVFVSKSTDGGATWGSPAQLTGAGDQFFPNLAVAANGTVNVSYYDDGYDPAGIMLGVTLARSPNGVNGWSSVRVTDVLSDVNHARWFSGATNGQTTFIGDYNGLTLDASGAAYLDWTDERVPVDPALQIPPNRVIGQNIFFARVP